jgi:glucose-6-phosphate 1-epimerase
MTDTEHPSVILRAADGAQARIQLDGAQVVSWIPAGSADDRLFVSRRAEYGPGISVRGGIPICFPQFGPFGGLPQHGFARNIRWRVSDDSRQNDGEIRLRLTSADVAAARPAAEVAAWPHAFSLEEIVQVHESVLTVRLVVTNTGSTPFDFTVALHPYFTMRDAFAASVRGLGGLSYRDALRDGDVFREDERTLSISGALDRIYYDAPEVIEVLDGHRTLRIEKSGFTDAVVWNPGAAVTGSKRDFEAGDENRMLCVEAATVRTPITLEAGADWMGVQRMIAVS